MGDSRPIVVIQARTGSSRLPGKVLADIAGKPMLLRVYDRAGRILGPEAVIVATTDSPADDALAELCQRHQIVCARGSEDDVLDRFYRVAIRFDGDPILRITADCPLLDPEISRVVYKRFAKGDCDYASNVLDKPTFPDGLDTEVFSFAALEQAWREARAPSEREHVTPYIWKNPRYFRLARVSNDTNLSALRWTVDQAEDLDLANAIYHDLAPNSTDHFGMAAILRWIDAHPQRATCNIMHPRNEGYANSLELDRVQAAGLTR